MKKILSFVMMCVLLVSMAACGSTGENSPKDTTAPIRSETQSNNETEATKADTSSDRTDSSEATGGNESVAPSDETKTPEETTEATEPNGSTEATTEATEPTERPTEPVSSHTHSYNSTVTAPTCENGGYTTHTCACGDSYVTDQTNAVGHKFGEWVTTEESTVTKNGTAERKCSVCGITETKKLDKLPIFHTHSYTDKVVAPTCTSEGYTVHTCSCGDTYTDTETAKTAHNYKSSVTQPTCTTEGYTTYTCSCGDTYIADKTAKAAHTYKDTVTPPTCTAEGYTTHKCTKCGGTVVDTKIAAKGHSYSDTVVEPTCENSGYTQHKCDRCGNTTKDTYTNAIGHAYSFTSDTATCTKAGTITETCGNCGNTKTSHSAAKGHGETQTVVTEATCQQEGKTQTICTVCNTVLSESTTPKGTCNYVTDTAINVSHRLIDSHNTIATQKAWIGQWDEGVLVDVCYGCYSLKNARIANGGASEMLGYVNQLRRSVGVDYGLDLELDSACITLAQLRAKEISTNFSHDGRRNPDGFFVASENIHRGPSANVYAHYNGWLNSPAHYGTMIAIGWTHFGYGAYLSPDALSGHNTYVYAVQIFAG